MICHGNRVLPIAMVAIIAGDLISQVILLLGMGSRNYASPAYLTNDISVI